ncbi:FkbM family methyltransferase [Trichocoleus sp. FACHB-591]|uniref:FkbM family methyltransferase n=1 Tax=Trichocoleus sp. FACHB-591 TaxID=2692872 RepID=UPI001685F922|nr:FkbM family methyltransferase [Trichocoleus sp. FACHB-591]MBD2093915.1 FkbM family methyltransferase [Trichocoleus sp. FACHB-591]
MKSIINPQQFWGKIHWKARQKYSQIRCYLNNGYYVWTLPNQAKFVSRQEDAFSHVLYVCKGHEKVEMNWCQHWIKAGQASQSIIDCGANIGYFSAVLSQACSLDKVLAIEGNHNTAELCRQNFKILDLNNIHVVESILSASKFEYYVIPDNPGKEPWQRAIQASPESRSSRTTTLDKLVSDFQLNPSLVKIDCEGFETLILKGACSLLKVIRPAFMIECNDAALKASGTNRYELFNLLRSFNYQLFHLASFTGSYPLGIALEDNFESSEFNFAAIPNDQSSLDRWNQSIQPFF